MKKISIAFLLACFVSSSSFSQDFKMPAPSPTTTVKQDFSTSWIELTYSRPSVKGRKIFGDLVPFGKEWRTGANGVTKVTFKEEVTFGDKTLAAGTYALYTIPGENEWEIILNKGLENWGLTGFNAKDNVLTTKVKSEHLTNPVETFTITFEDMTKNFCNMTLAWENTKVTIPVKADNEKRIEDWLNKELKGSKPPYLVAAQYYLEKKKNLNDALKYTDIAIKENPEAFYIHSVKAQILSALGKKDEAIKEAKIAAEATKGTPYETEYMTKYQELAK